MFNDIDAKVAVVSGQTPLHSPPRSASCQCTQVARSAQCTQVQICAVQSSAVAVHPPRSRSAAKMQSCHSLSPAGQPITRPKEIYFNLSKYYYRLKLLDLAGALYYVVCL